MTPEHWQQVKRLLEGALARKAEERHAYLEAACDGDPGLRRDVQSLLDTEEAIGDFIEEPAFDLHGGDPALPATGQRLGRYRLLAQIGRGGMGRVYLAERADEEYEQRVAIKVLKRGLDTDEILDRFRRERQILAHLDHPYIARLFDGGTTEDGLPYFVMEHVEGEPIDAYCDRRQLDIDARLRLFLAACSAVQQAHQSLVVHRDLKPGNILVTADGTPKLLDFGIAKLLSLEGDDDATRGDWQFLTPEYASPEQVRGDAVTTATDVFSLGTLLYLLLTGRRPFQTRGRSRLELEQTLLSAELERPSSVVSLELPAQGEGGEERLKPEDIARRRGTDPKGLRRRLAGDLDAILAKALERDPRRRYGSVEQLAEDLRRHLEGLPVTASRDSWVYRTGKLIRRHRVGVTATAAIFLLLVAFGVTTTLLLRNAIRERERADREFQHAQTVSQLLVGSFKISDPRQSHGETIPAREILDQGRRTITESSEIEPEIRASLLLILAQVYSNLGLNQEARPLAEESLQIRRAALGEDHLSLAESFDTLASIYRALGEQAETERLLRRALEIHRRNRTEGSEEQIGILNNLAVLLEEREELEEAESLHREVLEAKRRLYGEDHPAFATTLNNLAKVLLDQGRYAEAEDLYRQALEIRRRHLRDPNPEVATTENSLAAVLEKRGELTEAEGHYRNSLAMRRTLYPEGHSELATTLNNLALLLMQRGELEEAEALLEEALATPESILPTGSPTRAVLLRNLAAVLTAAGEGEAAEARARAALEIWRSRAPNSWRAADAESVLGGALARQGRFAEAEALLLSSYPTLEVLQGPNARFADQARQRLADLYAAAGEPEKAAAYRTAPADD